MAHVQNVKDTIGENERLTRDAQAGALIHEIFMR